MANSTIKRPITYGGVSNVSFNSDGVGTISDANIKADDVIVLQKEHGDYGKGISLTLGNTYNGITYMYANSLDGTFAKYEGQCKVNYIGYHL